MFVPINISYVCAIQHIICLRQSTYHMFVPINISYVYANQHIIVTFSPAMSEFRGN